MIELTKAEKRAIKAVIKIGILRRHAQWQSEMRELLNKPFDGHGNEFDRSMEITYKARQFYKEAMRMEDYYRNSVIIIGLSNLYIDGYIKDEDLTSLPEKVVMKLKSISYTYKE
jgi:hypothetical protein